MYIKKTTKKVKGKTYINHLLVESIATEKGPRHRIICSLGSLAPAPKEEWLSLSHRMQQALAGQTSLMEDVVTNKLVDKVPKLKDSESEVITIETNQVQVQEVREAGPTYVGHQMWKQLDLERILQEAGLSQAAAQLTEVMVINRLVDPVSKHATPDWVNRTALGDIVGKDFSELSDDALYRNLDQLHPRRDEIEKQLAAQERNLFNLEESILLYDLTSTYFEGQCGSNPKAKRGYSRDHRPDCKQVVVGLVIDADGFPKAHEVFEGNRSDTTTLDPMLAALEKRLAKKGGATVVVDRGMASAANLQQIQQKGYHYIVAARQSERMEHWQEYEQQEGWQQILRQPSAVNRSQKKSSVLIKKSLSGQQVHILCKSEGRKEKDRAIRQLHEKRLLSDLGKLAGRIENRQLINPSKIHQSIGRIRERYPLVARYYEISYDSQTAAFSFQENADKKQTANKLDGTYMIKTDRLDMSEEEIWRTYILLTRMEAAFRSMKSPLMERPIFHQLERRVETHIFLCVLAYHLLVCIEKMFLDSGIHTSWQTVRDQLRTHQVVSVLLKTVNGRILKIRQGTTPETIHKEIYKTLRIPETVMTPSKSWL